MGLIIESMKSMDREEKVAIWAFKGVERGLDKFPKHDE